MDAKPGDYVKVVCDNEEIEGTLIKSEEDSQSLFVKLKSGYNTGISRKRIKKVELLKKAEEKKEPSKKYEKKKGLKNITVLHTGGTIASRVDYRTGGVVASFTPEELLKLFPELGSIANIDSELVSNMWSDDLRFRHFSMIGKAVEKHIKKGAEGIIIGIGTDNLAVAAAALSFILEEINMPVILVGAQRSSDRGSSDAGMNLICAAEFIAKSDFAGVAICMHEYSSDSSCAILPACKTRKLHSSRRDAFRPVNDRVIARIDYKTKKIAFVKNDFQKIRKDAKPIVKPDMEEKVGLIKVHVNMFPEQFEFFNGYKGLVIEGTGLGHTPGHVPNEECAIHKRIFPAIKKLVDNGCVVVMVTQCIFGRVGMKVYDKGRDLLSIGVIPGEDMLAETALVKLSWLLANHNAEKAKELVSKNLRGEINSRIQEEQHLE